MEPECLVIGFRKAYPASFNPLLSFMLYFSLSVLDEFAGLTFLLLGANILFSILFPYTLILLVHRLLRVSDRVQYALELQ